MLLKFSTFYLFIKDLEIIEGELMAYSLTKILNIFIIFFMHKTFALVF